MTKEQFDLWDMVRETRTTNMQDDSAVSIMTGGLLSRSECAQIRQNYPSYRRQFGTGGNNVAEMKAEFVGAVNGDNEDEEEDN